MYAVKISFIAKYPLERYVYQGLGIQPLKVALIMNGSHSESGSQNRYY